MWKKKIYIKKACFFYFDKKKQKEFNVMTRAWDIQFLVIKSSYATLVDIWLNFSCLWRMFGPARAKHGSINPQKYVEYLGGMCGSYFNLKKLYIWIILYNNFKDIDIFTKKSL